MTERPKMLRVTWRDSVGDSGWHDADDTFSVDVIESVGFLVDENSDRLVLATSRLTTRINGPLWSGMVTIPAEAVVSKKVLQ